MTVAVGKFNRISKLCARLSGWRRGVLFVAHTSTCTPYTRENGSTESSTRADAHATGNGGSSLSYGSEAKSISSLIGKVRFGVGCECVCGAKSF